MLKKKERLDRRSFNRSFSLGKRAHSPHLMLIHVPENEFRASAVISKKVAKLAVTRNKFRRRVYDVFEQRSRTTPLRGSFMCIAKAGAADLPYNSIKEELGLLIHKTQTVR